MKNRINSKDFIRNNFCNTIIIYETNLKVHDFKDFVLIYCEICNLIFFVFIDELKYF